MKSTFVGNGSNRLGFLEPKYFMGGLDYWLGAQMIFLENNKEILFIYP